MTTSDPDAIRRDIENTRANLSADVDLIFDAGRHQLVLIALLFLVGAGAAFHLHEEFVRQRLHHEADPRPCILGCATVTAARHAYGYEDGQSDEGRNLERSNGRHRALLYSQTGRGAAL